MLPALYLFYGEGPSLQRKGHVGLGVFCFRKLERIRSVLIPPASQQRCLGSLWRDCSESPMGQDITSSRIRGFLIEERLLLTLLPPAEVIQSRMGATSLVQ